MEWPTNEECYDAMLILAEHYMDGDQKIWWKDFLMQGKADRIFPLGKGFLHDFDKAIKVSEATPIPKYVELYQLICTVCI